MGDIAIVFDSLTGTGDFVLLANGALLLGNELQSAVEISLFTDQVASPDDVLPPGQADDPRGWFPDTYEPDLIGSKLWQVFWRPATPDTLNWVNDTASKALQWMIDDGEAAAVTVDSQFNGKVKGQIDMTVLIVEPTGKRTPFTYSWKLEG